MFLRTNRSAIHLAFASALLAIGCSNKRADDLFLALPRYDKNYRRPPERCTGKLYAANGKRERERRVAQIAAGRLRVENGLVAEAKSVAPLSMAA